MIGTMKKSIMLLLACIMMVSVVSCKPDMNNEKIQFYNMSKKAQESYVVDFLRAQYNIDCELTKIEKRQINVFETERLYHTVASFQSNSFDVWIDDEGIISETYFLVDFQSEINQIVEKKLQGIFKSMRVYCADYFNNPPETRWNKNDDLLDGKLQDDNFVHRIRIAINESDQGSANLSDLNELLHNALSGFHGTIDIYCVSNTLLINNYTDFNDYPISQTFFLD